jgi:hypothetical protein
MASLTEEEESCDPMAVIEEGLLTQLQDGEVDLEKVEEAAVLYAAANLVRLGMSVDAVERKFRDEDYNIRITREYDEEEHCWTTQVHVDWSEDQPG